MDRTNGSSQTDGMRMGGEEENERMKKNGRTPNTTVAGIKDRSPER